MSSVTTTSSTEALTDPARLVSPRRREDASLYAQFRATLLRNWIKKKRGLKHTMREILMPLYFLLIIIILKFSIPEPFYPEVNTPEGESSLYHIAPFLYTLENHIYIVPDDEPARQFGQILQENRIFKTVNMSFSFLEDETSLEALFNSDPSAVYSGIVFQTSPMGDELSYKLRFTSDNGSYILPSAKQTLTSTTQCREKKSSDSKEVSSALGKKAKLSESHKAAHKLRKASQEFAKELRLPVGCTSTSYYWSGFTTIQGIIDYEWLKLKHPSHPEPSVLLQMLPKHETTGNSEYVLRSIVPLYLVISLSQFITPMLFVIVDEKEKKIKESLKMVGLRDSVFWLGWFIIYSAMVLIIVIVATLLTYFIVIPSTNIALLFFLMFEFGLTMIMFAFILTTLFSKAKPAGLVGGLSVLLISCLYYLQVYLSSSPEWVFWLLSLLSPTALAMALDKLMMFDLNDVPLDLWSSDGTMPVAGVLIMLFIDILLYGLLAVYLDNVLPTEYGTRRKPWFCLQPSYWSSSLRPPRSSNELMNIRNEDEAKFTGPDVEVVPDSMKGTESIVINDLQKTFTPFRKPAVHAVKGISMRIYPGEITAILGHNGAGKTTLFNMLTGMTSTTDGGADIFGYDINDANEMAEIRKLTGICPQHDVLFEELTPKEHLEYFARIRGVPEGEMEAEVTGILTDIDLLEKKDEVARDLSGGQKRKLSVGIALIGDPKIIFLDEPTAGVDPYSRRHLWSVLKQRKAGKVILLTTHFMDEADILADRKAILTQGTVRCYGSSLFLKNKFGVGYHLTLVLESHGDLPGIRQMIKSHIPEAEQARLFGRELSFVLPRSDVEKFPELFSEIEQDISSSGPLGVSSYGVSMTTLEEIFLHLGEEDEAAKDAQNEQEATNESATPEETESSRKASARVANNAEDKDMSGYSFEAIETHRTKWQSFRALAYIRFIRKFREPGSIIVQMILPVVYVIIGLVLTDLNTYDIKQGQEVRLNNDIYEDYFLKRSTQVYTYTNETGHSIDDFTDTIDTTISYIDSNYSYADYLQQSQMTSLSFKSAEASMSVPLNLTVLFNFTAVHGLPIVVNTVSNMFASLYGIPKINVTSQPFAFTEAQKDFDFSSFGGSMFIGFTYMFIPLGMAMELIEDREIRAKNQLRVNGVSFGVYFGSFYAVLGSMCLTLCAALLILVQAFKITSLIVPGAFGTLAILFILYTAPALLFCSTISYMFDKVENGQFLFPIGTYIGFIPYIVVTVLDMLQVGNGDIGTILHVVFLFISPPYIPFGIVYYINRQFLLNLCTKDECDLTFGDYMSEYEIYSVVFAIIFHTIVWYVALRIVDVVKDGGTFVEGIKSLFPGSSGQYSRLSETPVNDDTITEEDEDVREERQAIDHIMAADGSERVVTVQSLRKTFKSDKGASKSKKSKKKSKTLKVAVRNLSFGVKEGETFGLLGHNGAGKTTTMRIITAEEAPDCGRVRIGPYEIKSNNSEGFELLGYCPQFDALWRTVTVKEHLACYAGIRGVPRQEISRLSDQFMDGLHIQEHAKKYAKNCSGGTKRKLSYAMAMLGNPKIVLMDEPSTGMDPQSKRFVWDTVLASFKENRGAILTTHSMEEADALCNRVGIMVKGELRCIGSTQHLKNKYGAGYMLEIKLRNSVTASKEQWNMLESEVKRIFDEAEMVEGFADRRMYGLPQASVESLAEAFRALEKLKSEFDVEEYSFGQTTLEQVFIEFAKQQEAADALEEGYHEDNNEDHTLAREETTNSVTARHRQDMVEEL